MRNKLGLISLIVFCLFMIGTLVFGATADFDQRSRLQSPIAIEVSTVTIDVSENTTVGTATIQTNGEIKQIAVTVPALTGAAATVTVALTNEDGASLESKAALAEGATTVYRPTATTALAGTTTVTVTASEAQAADVNIKVVIYLR